MAGKYDKRIRLLFVKGAGSRKIAKKLEINRDYAKRRMKAMKLSAGGKNSYIPYKGVLKARPDKHKIRTSRAAENYLKYLCNHLGFQYAEPQDFEPYDLLVNLGYGWQRVQVKSSEKSGMIFLMKRKPRGNKQVWVPYTKEEIDYFFLFLGRNRRCWLVPFNVLVGKNRIRPEHMLPGFEIKDLPG